MDSLKRGFTFFVKALRLVGSIPGLRQIILEMAFTGLAVAMIGLIPVALAIYFLPGRIVGGLLVGFFSLSVFLAQLITAYIISGMVSGLVNQSLLGETPDVALFQARLNHRWMDLLSLSLGLLPNLIVHLRGSQPAWSRASYLVRPVVVNEDLKINDAVARVDEMVRKNILMMSPSQVGVSAVNAFIGVGLACLGGGLGYLAAAGVRSLTHATPLGLSLAVVVGVLVASVFLLVAAALGSLHAVVYHTCLYWWAHQAEQVLPGERRAPAQPPAPLAAALEGIASLSAPIYSEQ